MRRFFNSWPGTIIIAVALTLIVRFYVAQPFIVRGASMEPNFDDGDYLVIDELSYLLRDPQRGEVVVFHFPRDRKQFFIKRIIGLPGETITVKEGKVEIAKDGESFTLDEPYLDERLLSQHDNFSVTLKEGEYVVLGDNRASSSDSRVWGVLSKEFMVGRALVRLWPIDALAVIRAAEPVGR